MPSPPRLRRSINRVPLPTRENLLLGRLPSEDRARIAKILQPVTFDIHDIVEPIGTPMRRVYFPESGTHSTIVTMRDGHAAEVSNVGYDGMVGLGAFHGVLIPRAPVVCQMPGRALALPVNRFITELEAGGALRAVVGRYAAAAWVQTFQMAACYRLHTSDQRLVRWLLVSHDRAGADRFALTQQFLALMLGLHRPRVTVLAKELERAKVIEYRRGVVRILNRARLEAASCECYGVIRDALMSETSGPLARPAPKT